MRIDQENPDEDSDVLERTVLNRATSRCFVATLAALLALGARGQGVADAESVADQLPGFSRILLVDVYPLPDNQDPDIVDRAESAARTMIGSPDLGCVASRINRPDFFVLATDAPGSEELANAARLRMGIEGEGVQRSFSDFPRPVYIGASLSGTLSLREQGRADEPFGAFEVSYLPESVQLRSRGADGLAAAIEQFVASADEPREAPFGTAIVTDSCDQVVGASFLRALARALNRVADAHPDIAGMAVAFPDRVPADSPAITAVAGAPDIRIENSEAIVPANSVPGLAEMAGRPVGRIPGSFPQGLLDALELPSITTYMGMSRNRAPESLRFNFNEVIHGIPNTQSLFEERYAIFSACRVNSCPERGWFMIDIQSQQYVGAMRHFYWGEEESRTRGSLLIFSVAFDSYAAIPALYLQSLSHWAREEFEGDYYGDEDFAIVRFVNADGTVETVCRNCIPR